MGCLWDPDKLGFSELKNLGFWLENCWGNWKVKMQENPKESKSTKVWVTLVFVPLNSTTLDPIGVEQPKDLENCQEPVLEGLQVSEWCKTWEPLLEDKQASWQVENLDC